MGRHRPLGPAAHRLILEHLLMPALMHQDAWRADRTAIPEPAPALLLGDREGALRHCQSAQTSGILLSVAGQTRPNKAIAADQNERGPEGPANPVNHQPSRQWAYERSARHPHRCASSGPLGCMVKQEGTHSTARRTGTRGLRHRTSGRPSSWSPIYVQREQGVDLSRLGPVPSNNDFPPIPQRDVARPESVARATGDSFETAPVEGFHDRRNFSVHLNRPAADGEDPNQLPICAYAHNGNSSQPVP